MSRGKCMQHGRSSAHWSVCLSATVRTVNIDNFLINTQIMQLLMHAFNVGKGHSMPRTYSI